MSEMKNNDCEKIAKVLNQAIKYRNPRKKFMSVEQKDAYNKAIRKLGC